LNATASRIDAGRGVGKLTGAWNFEPRAVGTFDLTRPASPDDAQGILST
jgi:hypothetical protein